MPEHVGVTHPLAIPATSQMPLRIRGTTSRSTVLSAVSAFGVRADRPDHASLPVGQFAVNIENTMLQQLCFYATTAGVGNEWFEGQIIGYKELTNPTSKVSEFVPRVLARFNGRVRAAAFSGGELLDGTRPADRIFVINDYTHGSSAAVCTDAPDGLATLTFDAMGHEFLVVELTNRVPASETGTATATVGGITAGL
jgi:hypothetical protein